MRKAFALASLAAVLSGCGLFQQRPEGAIRVEAAGEGPDETSSANAARRAALTQVLDLYVADAKGGEDALEKKIYARAKDFMGRERELSRERGPGVVKKRLETWVNASILARALEAEGLSRPEGVRGRPRVAVVLKEKVSSASLMRELSSRGYRVEAAEAAPKDGAALSGSVSVSAVTDDPRLAGLFGARAKIEATLRGAGDPAPIAVEAQAFDVSRDGAAERALENAGLLAAEQARRRLAQLYVERAELSLIVENLGGEGQIRGMLRALRAENGISGAALDAVSGRDVKLKVFGERMTADELAARVMRLPGYRITVRAVDTDMGAVEASQSGEAPST